MLGKIGSALWMEAFILGDFLLLLSTLPAVPTLKLDTPLMLARSTLWPIYDMPVKSAVSPY